MILEIRISWPTLLALALFGALVWFLSRYYSHRVFWRIINEESDGLAFSKSLQNAGNVEILLKKLLKKRSSELQRLQTLEEYRKQYTGNVAHELRTPIFAVQGYIESIIDDKSMDKETQLRFLKKARQNIFRLEQIITDLDTINKFESQVLKLNKSNFDIYKLFEAVIDGLEFYAKDSNISFKIEGCSPGSHMVYADRDKIEQVLVNLGMNSIKYGNKNGLTKFILNDLAASVSIEISDNGIGIEKKSLNRIFERFYRADTSRSRSQGGSGLGLSICKHVIEAHNKKLFVFSKVGQGSVFSFQLDKSEK